MSAEHRTSLITIIYFLIATVLLVGEALHNQQLIKIFKPMLIPCLALLYFCQTPKKDSLYFLALALGLLSNILLLFPISTLLYAGVTTFLVYRIITIILVLRYTAKFHMMAFWIAVMPFLFVFTYIIDMTESNLDSGIYPAIANALVMSVLAALSLSNYVFEDDRRNSWLLISSLLFVVLMFIFVIERFYLENPVFRPLSVFIFTIAHFAFMKYLVLSERGPIEEPEI